jgi:hypothetical protein
MGAWVRVTRARIAPTGARVRVTQARIQPMGGRVRSTRTRIEQKDSRVSVTPPRIAQNDVRVGAIPAPIERMVAGGSGLGAGMPPTHTRLGENAARILAGHRRVLLTHTPIEPTRARIQVKHTCIRRCRGAVPRARVRVARLVAPINETRAPIYSSGAGMPPTPARVRVAGQSHAPHRHQVDDLVEAVRHHEMRMPFEGTRQARARRASADHTTVTRRNLMRGAAFGASSTYVRAFFPPGFTMSERMRVALRWRELGSRARLSFAVWRGCQRREGALCPRRVARSKLLWRFGPPRGADVASIPGRPPANRRARPPSLARSQTVGHTHVEICEGGAACAASGRQGHNPRTGRDSRADVETASAGSGCHANRARAGRGHDTVGVVAAREPPRS